MGHGGACLNWFLHHPLHDSQGESHRASLTGGVSQGESQGGDGMDACLQPRSAAQPFVCAEVLTWCTCMRWGTQYNTYQVAFYTRIGSNRATPQSTIMNRIPGTCTAHFNFECVTISTSLIRISNGSLGWWKNEVNGDMSASVQYFQSRMTSFPEGSRMHHERRWTSGDGRATHGSSALQPRRNCSIGHSTNSPYKSRLCLSKGM